LFNFYHRFVLKQAPRGCSVHQALTVRPLFPQAQLIFMRLLSRLTSIPTLASEFAQFNQIDHHASCSKESTESHMGGLVFLLAQHQLTCVSAGVHDSVLHEYQLKAASDILRHIAVRKQLFLQLFVTFYRNVAPSCL
jgi:hypothetical protein